jgi:tol-pal system protein YbgF
MRYRPTWSAVCAVLLALAGCASTPEEDPVLQNKLTDLDTRLTRIDRVVSNNSLLEISNEMADLRADLRAMHNDVDQLNHALDTNRKRERDLYADLDRRLKSLEARSGAPPGAAAAAGAASGGGAVSGDSPGAGGGAPGSSVASEGAAAGAAGSGAGEAATGAGGGATGAGGAAGKDVGSDSAAYQAAFALLKNSQYDQAIAAFQQFDTTYPDSSLADNAHYWLGEAYYVNKDFTDALAAFQHVVDKYPQSRKVPDAMLKVGYCDYELKQSQAAKDVLSQLTSNYPDTPAARLAQQRLDKMAGEKH